MLIQSNNCYGLQKTSLSVSVLPSRLAQRDPAYNAQSIDINRPGIRSFTCCGVGDVILVALALAPQSNSTTTLDLSLPFSGTMVERRDSPSWLRDDDDEYKEHMQSQCRALHYSASRGNKIDNKLNKQLQASFFFEKTTVGMSHIFCRTLSFLNM